jgi:Zn-dependent peptidase ImmA (M78 family)/transcriptional regulator with XRE-family HTH domain
MVVGVPAFQPNRLTQARALRQIPSLTALAELTGLSKQILSRYEAGEAKPTEENLVTLARTVNLPITFFLKPMPQISEQPIMFRSMAAALRTERGRARELLRLSVEAGQYFSEELELPPLNLPRLNSRGDIRAISDSFIEEAAIETRRVLGFPSGPLPNLVTLTERCGVMVGRTRLADKELDGVSQWSDTLPCVLLNSTKSPARSRFDLAHELGHLVLHSFLSPDIIESRTLFNLVENQAHRFASALLLPADEFQSELLQLTLDEFVYLKPRWQVSVQAMMRRARDLDVVDDDGYLRMIKQVSARKWRMHEPLEDVVAKERPTLLQSCLQAIAEGLDAGVEMLRTALPFLSVLEELADIKLAPAPSHTAIVDLRDYRRRGVN